MNLFELFMLLGGIGITIVCIMLAIKQYDDMVASKDREIEFLKMLISRGCSNKHQTEEN